MKVRSYIPGENVDQVLDLRAEVWGADHPHTDPAFYKWLFQDTPIGPGSGIIVERNDRVVGFAGMHIRLARHGDTTIRVSHGLDFMVSPSLGGVLSGRVMVKIVHSHRDLAIEKGFDCNLNYPNDNSHKILVSKRFEYEPVFETDLYLRTVGPVTFKDSGMAKRIGSSVIGRAGALYAKARSATLRKSATIEQVTQFDARFDDHWERLWPDGRLRFMRDAQTLQWRYGAHPLHDYTILAALKDGEVAGYAVVTTREIMSTDALLICDLAVAGDDKGVNDVLLEGVAETAKRLGTPLIVAQAVRTHPSTRNLTRAGFLRVPHKANPKPFRLIAGQYSDRGAPVLDANAWSFSWGDMDVV